MRGKKGDLMNFYSLPVEQVEIIGQEPTVALFGARADHRRSLEGARWD